MRENDDIRALQAEKHAFRVLEERNRAFRVLYDTVIAIEGATEDEVHAILCRNLREISNAMWAALASFDAHAKTLTLDALDTIKQEVSTADLGHESAHISASAAADFINSQVKECVEHQNCLVEFFPQIILAIAEPTDAAKCYRLSCVRGKKLIAVGAIQLKPGQKLKMKDLVDTYLNTAGLILQRVNAVRALREQEEHLEEVVEQRTAALTATNRRLQQEIAERKRVEQELREIRVQLEKRVEERTAELAQITEQLRLELFERMKTETEREKLLNALKRRNTQLQTVVEVSKGISTILDSEKLLHRAVNLIREQFGFYYVGVFLANENQEYVILQAGTGTAGQKMLAAGHKLAIGGESMIGWCVANAQARISLNVGKETVRFNNPLLPKTRSEMALPLLSRGQCIGALTVQSEQEAAFYEEDIAVLQSMADQLAIAVENAQFNEKLEYRVAERTAELALVNKELETFAYSIAHNLHAPLRSVDGFSQALREDFGDNLDEHGQDYLQRMRAASQRMSQMIDDLLHLSRVARREIHRETVDLSAIVREVADSLQQEEPTRQVEFIIAEGVRVYGDAQMMRELMENLLDNAWKFTRPQPRATIEFGVISHKLPIQPDITRWYFVRDNGVGFEMAYADKLFKAFQRLHGLTEFEGIGMGLAIVQRIIERHGGYVWAEGAVNRGAIFYFTL